MDVQIKVIPHKTRVNAPTDKSKEANKLHLYRPSDIND